ncbi:hypothetical protein B7990_03405 [Fibrobacter sp. UWB4]|nr:hypothetical protein B7990_03405 [Fibrobacter sp. UWB4]
MPVLWYQNAILGQFGNTGNATKTQKRLILINLYRKHDVKKHFFQLLVALFRIFGILSRSKSSKQPLIIKSDIKSEYIYKHQAPPPATDR